MYTLRYQSLHCICGDLRYIVLSCLCLLMMAAWRPVVAAEPVVIKFATLAPEGSPWMNLMQEMNDEIERQSQGAVTFRFYAGGVAGDERDVIRKMRIKQLHGGAFTGFGLGQILPAIRVLELPMLFRDQAEADHVIEALFPHFVDAFADKGQVLLSLNESGAVYLFSKQALRDLKAIRRAKIWLWQGDTLVQAIFKAFDMRPVPLTLPDVLPSLQSGIIDACYGTPLAVLAFQWFTKVPYRSSFPFTRVVGAFVVSQHQWNELSSEHQTLVKDMVQTYAAKASDAIRRYEQQSLPLLKSTGMQTVDIPETEINYLRQQSDRLYPQLVGELYDQDLLKRVLELRAQYRQKPPPSQ